MRRCCIQTFQALCDTESGFPPQLLQAARSAYDATKQDVRFLLPCLPALAKDELRALLPQIVALSSEDVVAAFRRILDVRAARPCCADCCCGADCMLSRRLVRA